MKTEQKTVYIMRGLPGSGKSTYTKKNFPDATVCSADSFFMNEGEYRFDPSKLAWAHQQCQEYFSAAVEVFNDFEVVVDNTNTTSKEMKFYIEKALENHYNVVILEFYVTPEVSAARNTHGVPLEAIKRMAQRLANPIDPVYKKYVQKVIEGPTKD